VRAAAGQELRGQRIRHRPRRLHLVSSPRGLRDRVAGQALC
jgi:hypothetical protein